MKLFTPLRNTILIIYLLFGSNHMYSQDYIDDTGEYVDIEASETPNINSNTSGYQFQEIKRAVINFWSNSDESMSPFFRSSGILLNTVKNSFEGTNGHKVYLLIGQHFLNKLIDANPNDNQVDIWLSFDFELPDDNTSQNHLNNILNDFTIQRLYKTPCKIVLASEDSDTILLEADFSEVSLSDHLAFLNSYAAGWNLHPDYITKGFNLISHPRNGPKKIHQNYQGEIKLSDKRQSNYPSNGYKYIGLNRQGWTNTTNQLEFGCCGSALLDNEVKVFAVSNTQGKNNAFFPLLENTWVDNYDNLSNNTFGLMHYLDPDNTWISNIKGGYLKDLIPIEIPNDNFFDFNVTTTPEPIVLNLNSLNFFKFENRLSNVESILRHGIKTNITPSNNIYFTLSTFNTNPELVMLNDNILYGVYFNNAQNNLPDLNFAGLGWPREDGHGPILPSLFDGNTDNIKNGLLGYLRATGRQGTDIELLSDFDFDAKLSLQTNTGTAQVRAVKLPNQMPYNARELFETEINPLTGEIIFDPYANLWQSYKYHPNRFNSQNLNINSITLKNWDKPKGDRTDTEPIVTKTIETGNNGGYLNLVNPNYSFSPVELSWEDPNDATNSKDRFIELEIKLNKQITGPISFSVWIDYFNRDSFLGRNVSDKTYNFVFDEIQNHPSELLVSSANIDANTTISHPDDQTILINAKLPPIGIGPNNSLVGKKRLRIAVIEGATPPTQGLVDNTLAGEVEDYLINLVPPSDALNIDKQLAEMLKNTANIRHKKRKKSGDQDPACNQGDETGEQMYDETGLDNSPFQRTCSIWEGPCVSGDTCHALYQLDNNAEGGELVSLSGNNFVEVDRTGVYTRGDFENGFTALTTYSPSNPYCETCDSEYILKQGSIQGDNDGDGGGDGDGDGWGLRLNPDAEDPVIELEVDVNNQQEIISVPLKEWLAQDPNQKFDIMVKKEQREIALMVRSRYTNTYDEEEVMLNTSVMNITQITTLGGGVSQVHNNTSGKIYDFMFNNTPTTNEEDKIIFENATETTITYNKSNSTVGKDNNINTTKLNTETEDQPDFSLYPNPAKDKINILVEVRQEGPLYIDIFDMNGRQVYSINRPNITQGHQLITLPIQNLSAGNYIVKIRAGDVLRSEKVVVK